MFCPFWPYWWFQSLACYADIWILPIQYRNVGRRVNLWYSYEFLRTCHEVILDIGVQIDNLQNKLFINLRFNLNLLAVHSVESLKPCQPRRFCLGFKNIFFSQRLLYGSHCHLLGSNINHLSQKNVKSIEHNNNVYYW